MSAWQDAQAAIDGVLKREVADGVIDGEDRRRLRYCMGAAIRSVMETDGATGDLTRLDLHPDDLLGNESVRSLCAHHLGQETPVTRPTLLKWRKVRGFPKPLPCSRAGVELWDARQVRAWIRDHARERLGS